MFAFGHRAISKTESGSEGKEMQDLCVEAILKT